MEIYYLLFSIIAILCLYYYIVNRPSKINLEELIKKLPKFSENTIYVPIETTGDKTSVEITDTTNDIKAEVTVTKVVGIGYHDVDSNIVSIKTKDGLIYYKVSGSGLYTKLN